LTVVSDGFGRAEKTPRGNQYSQGTTVTVRALPDADQEFGGWSGDASGMDNPLVLTADGDRVVVARFTRRPRLTTLVCDGSSSADAFKLVLTGEYRREYSIEVSTNLQAGTWTSLGTIYNRNGFAPFTDPIPQSPGHRSYRAVLVPVP
jgi:hypothetical protein